MRKKEERRKKEGEEILTISLPHLLIQFIFEDTVWMVRRVMIYSTSRSRRGLGESRVVESSAEQNRAKRTVVAPSRVEQ